MWNHVGQKANPQTKLSLFGGFIAVCADLAALLAALPDGGRSVVHRGSLALGKSLFSESNHLFGHVTAHITVLTGGKLTLVYLVVIRNTKFIGHFHFKVV